MSEYLLEVAGLKKSFGGVAALKDGSFKLKAGSVHALCGGNGAGKSTFLTIVMGIQDRNSGTIKINGEEVLFSSPSEALDAGISIIEQELSSVPAMSVAENIYLGRETVGRFGTVDFKTMNKNAQALLDSLNFQISATSLMMELSVAELQLVEIAKALSYDAKIIIMDEPTSALGEAEADQLFEATRQLKSKGAGIIYVSHRLAEIFTIADSYTVFRDGSYVSSGNISETNREKLIQEIVGRPLTEEFVKGNIPTNNVVLEIKNLCADEWISNINIKVHKGEIVALYGLMGSGRSEILEVLFGLRKKDSGDINLDGNDMDIRAPSQAIKEGLAFVTEDRKGTGLVLTEDVRGNICLAKLDDLTFGPIMSQRKESEAAKNMIDLFKIKTASDRLLVSGLSGGNQQKVVLGKWFLTSPKVLLLDEPTRGVDVGAKREIYNIMSDFTKQGGAVLMVSSETDEVLGMADRVYTIRDGHITGELDRVKLSPEELLHLIA